MAGRIPDSYIDDVLTRTDIAELIGARIALRRAGHEFTARCPFHEERSPSFTVSAAKQFYHCFGCGAHGSAIGFLMAYDHLSFPEAVLELASQAGLPPPEGNSGDGTPATPDLYPVLAAADQFFRAVLRNEQAAGPARDYLKGRGLTGAIAGAFGLGYALPRYDALLTALGPNWSLPQLLMAGLATQDERGVRDKFRDRVMFPIEDSRGRIVGFGGRALGDAKPKYLNSPETPVFHKGTLLYGLHRAQKHAPAPQTLIIVEGYLDVIALAQFGITNAVATLGTAATPEHLRRALRVCPELVFCFDGDAAGQRAAYKALETVLGELRDGQQVRFLTLPAGDDPDTLVRREGAAGFRARLDDATPLAEQLLQTLKARTNLGTLEGKARLVELAKPLIAKLPSGIYRNLLEQRLADEAGLPITQVSAHLRSIARGGQTPPPPVLSAPTRQGPSLVRQMIGLLMQHPHLGREIAAPKTLAEIPGAGAAFLGRLCATLAENPDRTLGALLELWRETADGALLGRALATPTPSIDEDAARDALRAGLERLKSRAARPTLESLLKGRRPADLGPEERARLADLTRRR